MSNKVYFVTFIKFLEEHVQEYSGGGDTNDKCNLLQDAQPVQHVCKPTQSSLKRNVTTTVNLSGKSYLHMRLCS